MPIDTSIITRGLTQPQQPMQNPFELIGDLQQLKSNQQNIEHQRSVLESQRLAQEAARRKAEDDAKLDAIVARHARQDGELDTDGILADMQSAGMSSQVFALRKQVLDWTQTQAQTRKETIANNGAALHSASGLVNAFLRNTTDDQLPVKFAELKMTVGKLVGPDLAGMLGDTPDREHLKQLMEGDAATLQANLAQQKVVYDRADAAMGRAQAAMKNEQDFNKALPNLIKEMREIGSQSLTIAAGLGPQAYDEAYKQLQGGLQWMPKEARDSVLSPFAPSLTPQAKEQARRAGMTQAELSAEQGRNAGLGMERERLGLEQQRVSIERDRLNTTAGAEELPQEYKTLLTSVLMKTPQNRKKEVVDTVASLYKQGNLQGVKDILKQAALGSETVDIRNSLISREATVGALTGIKETLVELKAKKVPTGWLAGTMEDLARKLGRSTNPEYAEIGTRLTAAMAQYRRGMTGAQFSQMEAKEYASLFPNYRNQLPVNLAVITGMEKAMGSNDRAYWESKVGKEGAKILGVGGETPASTGGLYVTYQGNRYGPFKDQVAMDQFKKDQGIK